MDEKKEVIDVVGTDKAATEVSSFKCNAGKGEWRVFFIALLTSAIVVAIYHFTVMAVKLFCQEDEQQYSVCYCHQSSGEEESEKKDKPARKRKLSPEQRERFKKMTPEQREEFKKRREQFKNMTPEQREEFKKRAAERREQFKNMTPEQRKEFRKRFGKSGVRSRGQRPASPADAPAEK